MCLYLQERRRTEIVSKLEQVQELEKEAAVQERKELFEQRKAQKNKIITLTNQVANVEMVGINTSSVCCVLHCTFMSCSMRNGTLMTDCILGSSGPKPSLRSSTSLLNKHTRQRS